MDHSPIKTLATGLVGTGTSLGVATTAALTTTESNLKKKITQSALL